MRRLLQFAKNHPKSIAASAVTSAAVPSSGLACVDHSQGASAAATQLSVELGDALDDLELSGNIKTSARQLVNDLDGEASRYTNSKLPEDDTRTEWKCSQDERHLVSAAWKCAHQTYHLEEEISSTAYCTFQTNKVVKPSDARGVKAMTATTVTPTTGGREEDGLLPALIIAIRGSASKMDHIVNANHSPRSASTFLGLETSSTLSAHSGFLTSAEAMQGQVSQVIREYMSDQGQMQSHIVFTGHSAGGAVASLFYLRFLSSSDFNLSAKFSCITFGAPPIITRDLDIWQPTPPLMNTMAVDIVNEFDVVSRADRPYILALLNLLRHKHGHPPLPLDPELAAESVDSDSASATSMSKKDFLPAKVQDMVDKEVENVWPLPEMFYHHVGQTIVLTMRLDDEDQTQLKAFEVPDSTFGTLLFCKLSVHRKAVYSERIQLLEQGNTMMT